MSGFWKRLWCGLSFSHRWILDWSKPRGYSGIELRVAVFEAECARCGATTNLSPRSPLVADYRGELPRPRMRPVGQGRRVDDTIPESWYGLAQDWLRACARLRKDLAPSQQEQFDAITREYIRNLRRQGFDFSRIDAPLPPPEEDESTWTKWTEAE